MNSEPRPTPTIRYTPATQPFGAVTNEVTDGWAVIDVEQMEVAEDRLYATEEDALRAAVDARTGRDAELRANRFFDEELTILEADDR